MPIELVDDSAEFCCCLPRLPIPIRSDLDTEEVFGLTNNILRFYLDVNAADPDPDDYLRDEILSKFSPRMRVETNKLVHTHTYNATRDTSVTTPNGTGTFTEAITDIQDGTISYEVLGDIRNPGTSVSDRFTANNVMYFYTDHFTRVRTTLSDDRRRVDTSINNTDFTLLSSDFIDDDLMLTRSTFTDTISETVIFETGETFFDDRPQTTTATVRQSNLTLPAALSSSQLTATYTDNFDPNGVGTSVTLTVTGVDSNGITDRTHDSTSVYTVESIRWDEAEMSFNRLDESGRRDPDDESWEVAFVVEQVAIQEGFPEYVMTRQTLTREDFTYNGFSEYFAALQYSPDFIHQTAVEEHFFRVAAGFYFPS